MKQIWFRWLSFLLMAAVPAIALSGAVLANTQTPDPTLKALESDRQELLIETRQFKMQILEEIRLVALKKKNAIIDGAYELESRFDQHRFDRLLAEALWIHLAFGGAPQVMEQYYRLSLKIISYVEPGETLKESYGVSIVTDQDRERAKQQFQAGLKELTSIFYLRHLVMEDAVAGIEGFRAFLAPLQRHQAAEQFRAEADDIMLKAEQQLTQDIITGIPLVGEALDIISITTGEAALTGEKLSATQRTIDALLLLAPNALEAAFAAKPAFLKNLDGLAKKIDDLDPGMLKKLSASLGKSTDQLRNLSRKIKRASEASFEAVVGTYTAAQKKLRKMKADMIAGQLDDDIAYRLKQLSKTPEMDEAAKVWKQAGKKGKEKINAFAKKVPPGAAADVADPDLLDAYQAIRKDKRALNELQKGEYQALREQMQDLENKLFSHVDMDGKFVMGSVDVEAMENLKKGFSRKADPERLAKIKAKPPKDLTPGDILLLKKEAAREKIISQVKLQGMKKGVQGPEYLNQALDFDNLKITVFNATNKPPDIGKIGFDRDITYQIEIPETSVLSKNPKTGRMEVTKIPPQKIDIPAQLVEEQYHRSLYKKLNPEKPMPARDKVMAFGRDMDHQVTDAFHKDAYRLDKNENLSHITDFFKDPTQLATQGTRLEAFGDTVTYKSKHWFDMAKKAEDPGRAMAEVAEGMRQAAKQKENYMNVLADYYGAASVAKNMNPRLEKGLHIFEMVRGGRLSVPDAEAALKTISMTKEEVVEGLGQYFEAMVKLNAKSNKAVQKMALKKAKREALERQMKGAVQ
jgi:hypothetical protein